MTDRGPLTAPSSWREICVAVAEWAEGRPARLCLHQESWHGRAEWDGQVVCHGCSAFVAFKHAYKKGTA